MKEYLNSLQKVFSQIENHEGESIEQIIQDIKKLKLYETEQAIDTDFFLKLLFRKDIRTGIQKVLSMNNSTMALSIHTHEFGTEAHSIHKNIKEITDDRERLKTIILNNGIYQKLSLTKEELDKEKNNIKRMRDIIRSLMLKLNQC